MESTQEFEFKKPTGIPQKRATGQCSSGQSTTGQTHSIPSPSVPSLSSPSSYFTRIGKMTEIFFFKPLVNVKDAEEDLFDLKTLLSSGLF